MLTEYLAHAIHEERMAELNRSRLGREARAGASPPRRFAWFSGRIRQVRASRERNPAATAGHSLSTME